MKAIFQKPQSWAVLMVALSLSSLFFSAHFPDKRVEKTVVNRQKVPEHLVLVEGGTFEMGDCFGESGNDETVHTVTVRSFLLAKHELTFEEFDAFCEATNREKPKDFGWGRGTRPVIWVSWLDAVTYCNWRSQQEGLIPAYSIRGENVTCNWSANGYRLPTEAEWEYAAREKGRKVRYGNGKDIGDPKELNFNGAFYSKDYSLTGENRRKTVPVGSLNSPNSLGLHDMSGNVWEWCWDWFDERYSMGPLTDPKGPESGSKHVVRGGSWFNFAENARAANRYAFSQGLREYDIGFRLARNF